MDGMTVGKAGEFGLIRRIMHDFIYRPELVVVGPGDDGAVYRTPPGYDQVISTDTMVEGIHFTKETMSPFDVGYHLGACNFSDMAAMGQRRQALCCPSPCRRRCLFPGWMVYMKVFGPCAVNTG